MRAAYFLVIAESDKNHKILEKLQGKFRGTYKS